MSEEFSGHGARVDAHGAHFRVWAPEHRALEVVLFDADGQRERARVAMARAGGGFFEATVPGERAGALYKLRVDGEGPYPDPAARAQPHGVHGPSALVAADFPWTDDAWRGLRRDDLVIYEAHVGTATVAGTFDGLIERLGDIRALGITALEVMPVAAFPGERNWGYDGVALYAPAAPYGGPDGLRRLVDAAHAVGLGVILDVVYNHLGPDGNYLRAFARGYFTDRHRTPWGDALNFDGGEAAVREFFVGNAEMWLRDYHLDGLRLDATHQLKDDSPRHILTEIAQRGRAAARERAVVFVAEDERNEVALLRPAVQGGVGLDGVWADDLHHQLRRAFAGDSDGYYQDFTGAPEDIAATLRKGWFYTGQHSANQGAARGTPPTEAAPPQFVHCIQNHDQVGNRALGDRLTRSVSPAAYRAMSALLLLSPYTPLLFMGQEWAASTPFLFFTDHSAELGRAVTRGRREEFQAFAAFAGAEIPDPQHARTFETSCLDWDERLMPEHRGVLELYRQLLALRATHRALRSRERGAFDARAVGAHAVALERGTGAHGALLVLVNIRGRLARAVDPERRWRVVLSSEEARFGGDPRGVLFAEGVAHLAGPAALVLETEPRAAR